MELNNIAEKVVEKRLQVAEKAKDVRDDMAGAVDKGMRKAGKKVQEIGDDVRKGYYNPIMPPQFEDEAFSPLMIVIADGQAREGVEVCKGAVGWMVKKGGLGVFHIYQSFVAESGLSFEPFPEFDGVYCRHPFDRDRFINVKCFTDVLRDERVAELRHIAHALGAKRYKIEIWEEEKTVTRKKGHGGAKVKQKAAPIDVRPAPSVEGTLDAAFDSAKYRKRSVMHEGVFEGDAVAQAPLLRWYRNDANVKALLDARLVEGGMLAAKVYRCQVSGSSVTSMNAEAAGKVDAALKGLKFDCDFDLRGEVKSETRQTLCLEIEF